VRLRGAEKIDPSQNILSPEFDMQLQPMQSRTALSSIPSAPSRLTHQRLRQPTRLPTLGSRGPVGRYLERLGWLFGAG
jgi:hypothetical protein